MYRYTCLHFPWKLHLWCWLCAFSMFTLGSYPWEQVQPMETAHFKQIKEDVLRKQAFNMNSCKQQARKICAVELHSSKRWKDNQQGAARAVHATTVWPSLRSVVQLWMGQQGIAQAWQSQQCAQGLPCSSALAEDLMFRHGIWQALPSRISSINELKNKEMHHSSGQLKQASNATVYIIHPQAQSSLHCPAQEAGYYMLLESTDCSWCNSLLCKLVLSLALWCAFHLYLTSFLSLPAWSSSIKAIL